MLSAGDSEAKPDVFISFRHKDARKPARALRLALLKWKLPPGVRAGVTGPLRVYLDTFEGRVAEDYWRDNIEPALKKSRFLVVLISPKVFEPLPDGGENWVIREIKGFLETAQQRNIIPIYTRDCRDKVLPEVLAKSLPRVQTFDLGNQDSFIPVFPLVETPARFEFLRIVAAIRQIAEADLQKLFKEEWRRKVSFLAKVGLGAALVVAAIFAGGIVALLNGIQSARAAAQADLRAALERNVERPDEAALLALRALNSVTAPILLKPFLHDDERRIREVLGSITLSQTLVRWPGGRISEMVVSPDRDRLAVSTEREVLAVYDARTATELFAVQLPNLGQFVHLAFLGRKVVLSSVEYDDTHVIVVDEEGRQITHRIFRGGDGVRVVEGGRIAHWSAASGRLQLLDPVSGDALVVAREPVGKLEAVLFLPEIERLIVNTAASAIGSYEQHVFNTTNGNRVGELETSFQRWPDIEVARDARILFRVDADGNVERIDLVSGKHLSQIPSPFNLPIYRVSSSPSGQLGVVSRAWAGGLLEPWDLLAAKPLSPAISPASLMEAPVFSTSGRQVALLMQTEVLIVDQANPTQPTRIALSGIPSTARFVNDDRWLAVADLTGRVTVWEVTTGQPLLRGIKHHEGHVALEWSPNGQLVSAGWDGSIRFTSVPMREPFWSSGVAADNQSRSVTGVAVHPSEDTVAYISLPNQLTVCAVGAAHCKWKRDLARAAQTVEFGDQGRILIVELRDGGFIAFEAANGSELVSAGAGAADSAAKRNLLAIATDGDTLKVIDARSKAVVCRGAEMLEAPSRVLLTPDASLAIVIAKDNGKKGARAMVFDANSCQLAWRRDLEQGGIQALAISDRYGVLAVGGLGGGAVFRLADGSPTSVPIDDRNSISHLSFNPTLPILLAAGFSRRITAYDIETGKQMFSPIESAAIPWALSFSPSGHRFAAGFITSDAAQRFSTKLYDSESGQPLGAPFNHPSDVLAVAISASGRYLITGGADGVVRAWNIGPDQRPFTELFSTTSLIAVQTIELGSGAIRSLTAIESRALGARKVVKAIPH